MAYLVTLVGDFSIWGWVLGILDVWKKYTSLKKYTIAIYGSSYKYEPWAELNLIYAFLVEWHICQYIWIIHKSEHDEARKPEHSYGPI